ncbi:MAG: hypothetical protein Q8M92_07670 [Candidatus Subteraquimicrobiales bacterium]|nr:hypothetical protein [Candidatus Subteraquimicrobiales bacterium]
MNTLKNYKLIQPNNVPESAGVFAIARYIDKNSTAFEILHCDESENIKLTAGKIMAEKKFDGFDKSIIYLVLLELDPKRRIEFLQALKSDHSLGK